MTTEAVEWIPACSTCARRGVSPDLTLTLTPAELHALTSYTQPARQLDELHRQGFARARRDRFGRVILERAHYDAVCAGAGQPARPKVRLMVHEKAAA
jgi:hypothetical protein